MQLRSPIFGVLVALYEESQAGRTGRGSRDVQPAWSEVEAKYRQLFQRPLEGGEYDLALQELGRCDGRLLKLEWENRRARTTILKIRLAPAQEAAFYDALGRASPTARRAR